MSTEIMEAQLRAALDSDGTLAKRSFQARLLQPSGVGLRFGPNDAGVWHWRNGLFELHAGGDGPAVAFETVAEAVRYTRERLAV